MDISIYSYIHTYVCMYLFIPGEVLKTGYLKNFVIFGFIEKMIRDKVILFQDAHSMMKRILSQCHFFHKISRSLNFLFILFFFA